MNGKPDANKHLCSWSSRTVAISHNGVRFRLDVLKMNPLFKVTLMTLRNNKKELKPIWAQVTMDTRKLNIIIKFYFILILVVEIFAHSDCCRLCGLVVHLFNIHFRFYFCSNFHNANFNLVLEQTPVKLWLIIPCIAKQRVLKRYICC